MLIYLRRRIVTVLTERVLKAAT